MSGPTMPLCSARRSADRGAAPAGGGVFPGQPGARLAWSEKAAAFVGRPSSAGRVPRGMPPAASFAFHEKAELIRRPRAADASGFRGRAF